MLNGLDYPDIVLFLSIAMFNGDVFPVVPEPPYAMAVYLDGLVLASELWFGLELKRSFPKSISMISSYTDSYIESLFNVLKLFMLIDDL